MRWISVIIMIMDGKIAIKIIVAVEVVVVEVVTLDNTFTWGNPSLSIVEITSNVAEIKVLGWVQ